MTREDITVLFGLLACVFGPVLVTCLLMVILT